VPTLTYLEGFEHGTQMVAGVGNGLCQTLNGTGTDTVTALASRGSHSAFGLRLTTTGVNVWREVHLLGNVGTQALVGSFYWRPTDFPTTNAKDIMYVICGAGFLLFNFNPTTSKLQANVLIGANSTVAGPVVELNRWYRVDFKILTGTTWSIDWAVDGVAYGQASVGSQAATNMANYVLDANATGTDDPHGCSWDYDDVVLSTTTGDYPLGEAQVVGITADQAAAAAHQSITTTQWDTTSNFSSFTNFTGQTETTSRGLINDLDTADGIRVVTSASAAAAGNARWPVADPVGDPGTDPWAVTLITAGREASAAANNVILRTLVGASTTDHFNADPGWGTTWNYIRSIMTAKPGGGAWTRQNVLDINFEMDSTDATPAIWLSGFFYEVAFPPDPFPYVIAARR
jgi:hypothetical protein